MITGQQMWRIFKTFRLSLNEEWQELLGQPLALGCHFPH
jgi:hypothetical protein